MTHDREEGRCRLREADVHVEVSEPQGKCCAASPVHDEREQDDGQDDDHQPQEEHHNAGDCVPRDFSRSSHVPRLPSRARLIPNSRVRLGSRTRRRSSPPRRTGGCGSERGSAYAEARLAVGPISRASTSPANAVPCPIDATNQSLSPSQAGPVTATHARPHENHRTTHSFVVKRFRAARRLYGDTESSGFTSALGERW